MVESRQRPVFTPILSYTRLRQCLCPLRACIRPDPQVTVQFESGTAPAAQAKAFEDRALVLTRALPLIFSRHLSFGRSVGRSFINSFIHSFILFIHTFNRSCIHLFQSFISKWNQGAYSFVITIGLSTLTALTRPLHVACRTSYTRVIAVRFAARPDRPCTSVRCARENVRYGRRIARKVSCKRCWRMEAD